MDLNPFFKQVYTLVEQIPYGRVISYGEIARMMGRPRAVEVNRYHLDRLCIFESGSSNLLRRPSKIYYRSMQAVAFKKRKYKFLEPPER